MSLKPSYIFSLLKYSGLAVGFGLAASFSAGPAWALATWIGSWDYVLRHDQEGKPQAVFARLRGEDESLLWLTCSRYSAGAERPDAVSVTAAISQKAYLGRSAPRGRSTVYWFDDGSPELSYWVYRERAGQLANSEQVLHFLEKLTQASSLVVELSNYRFETLRLEFQFDASDTKAVAERFRHDCRAISGSIKPDQVAIR